MRVNTVTFDKQALKNAIAGAGTSANKLAYTIGRSHSYITNMLRPHGISVCPVNTARLVAQILKVPLESLIVAEPTEPEAIDRTDDQPTYLRSDDATLRQLVDQLYAMNAKLNVLYKMVAHLEETLK